VYCPECGFPVAAALKKLWEASPEGKAELAEKQKHEKREREDKERAELKAKQEKEEEEKTRKLEIFKELRDKLGDE
jgi:hypothetical protein